MGEKFKFWIKIVALLLLLVTGNSVLFAQQYPWRHYTTDDGLVESQVMCLYEDVNGFIWMGTKGGVSRFDGLNFDNFTISDGLINNQVKFITRDSLGTIWMFSIGGVNRFKDGELSTYKVPDFNKAQSVVIDSENRVWCIHQINDVAKLIVIDRDSLWTGDLNQRFPELHNPVWIALDKCNNAIRFGNGVTNWLLDSDSLQEVEFKELLADQIFEGSVPEKYQASFRFTNQNLVECAPNISTPKFVIDHQGGIWYVPKSDELMVHCVGDNIETFKEPFYFLNALLVDRYNHIWVGTEYGVWKLMDQAFVGYHIEEKLEYPWKVFEDSKNNLWVSNYGTGLAQLSGDQLSFWKGEIFPRYLYGGVEGPDNDMYFFGRGGFFQKVGDRFDKILGFSPKNDRTITHSVFNEYDSCFYIAVNGNRLFRWQAHASPINLSDSIGYFSNIDFLQVDLVTKGIIIGTKDRIVRIYDGNSRDFEIQGFSDQGARTCWQDPGGVYWFGNARGIAWFDGESSGFINEEPFHSGITSIVKIDSSNFIIGTPKDIIKWDYGKYQKDSTIHYQRYNEFNGYLGGGVRTEGIIQDHSGTIWICGENQLVKWDTKGSSNVKGRHDLCLREIHWLSDSISWIKCTHNLCNSESGASSISLKHSNNSLRIQLGSISAPVPEEAKIEYYLEGYEAGWNKMMTSQEIIYSQLKPGKYLFHYKPDAPGFVPDEKELLIWIHPAFYQTWLFKITVPLILVTLIVLLVWRILYRVHKNQRLIAQQEKENSQLKLHVILNQMNPHFSHNVLNSIGALIFSSQPQEVYKQLTRFSKMLRGLLQDEGSFIIPLEQELDFVANYLELEKLRFEDRIEYILPVLDEAVKQIPIPKLLIQIPVENAMKHGLSSTSGIGHLKISVCSKEHETQISIEDDGIGVAESKRRGLRGTGRGFEIMDSLTRFANQERVGKYSYELEDLSESSLGKSGTIVRIVIGTN